MTMPLQHVLLQTLRFGLGGVKIKDSSSEEEEMINSPQLKSLSLSPQQRTVRVHDAIGEVPGAVLIPPTLSTGMAYLTDYYISGHPDCKVHLTPQCETKVVKPNGDWYYVVTGGTAERGLKAGQRVNGHIIPEKDWMKTYYKDDL